MRNAALGGRDDGGAGDVQTGEAAKIIVEGALDDDLRPGLREGVHKRSSDGT